MPLILYSTVGCHLCEEAEALLRALQPSRPELAWQTVDIADDDALFERYGWSIPVLRKGADAIEAQGEGSEQGQELAWPFDAGALLAFLDA